MALLNRSDELAEALAVLDDVLALREIRQRNLVAVRDILLRHERPERCAVLIGDALSALHFLDTRHDIIVFVHQQCIDALFHVHSSALLDSVNPKSSSFVITQSIPHFPYLFQFIDFTSG